MTIAIWKTRIKGNQAKYNSCLHQKSHNVKNELNIFFALQFIVGSKVISNLFATRTFHHRNSQINFSILKMELTLKVSRVVFLSKAVVNYNDKKNWVKVFFLLKRWIRKKFTFNTRKVKKGNCLEIVEIILEIVRNSF